MREIYMWFPTLEYGLSMFGLSGTPLYWKSDWAADLTALTCPVSNETKERYFLEYTRRDPGFCFAPGVSLSWHCALREDKCRQGFCSSGKTKWPKIDNKKGIIFMTLEKRRQKRCRFVLQSGDALHKMFRSWKSTRVSPALSEYGQSEFPLHSNKWQMKFPISPVLNSPLNSKFSFYGGSWLIRTNRTK